MTQVLVTRPVQDAASWTRALNQAGFEATQFPLLDVKSAMGPEEAAQVLRQIRLSQAVMFVSANAVRFLAEALNDPMQGAMPWVDAFNSTTRAWCTGPGTAAALLACGISEQRIDQPAASAAQLDSEALWELVQAQVKPGMKVLFIRGADESGAIAGRDWLTDQLASLGAQVQAVATYQRQATPLTATQKERVQHYVDQHAIWLFSSSACIESLVTQCPNVDWSKAKSVVTHPRIAALAQQLGWPSPTIAKPGIHSLLASIQSLE